MLDEEIDFLVQSAKHQIEEEHRQINEAYASQYVLVEDGTIYETNPLLTLDFSGVNAGSGEEFKIDRKTNTLLSRLNYIDEEESIPNDISYNHTKFEKLGKILKEAGHLEDFFDDPSLGVMGISKKSNLEYKVIRRVKINELK